MKYFLQTFILASLIITIIPSVGANFSDTGYIDGNTLTVGDKVEQDLTGKVVINEVYYDPDDSHGGANGEWLEIMNVSKDPINIKDWIISDNNTDEEISQNYVIEPGQLLLIASNANIWNFYWSLIPDNVTKIALGGIRLFNGLGNDGDRLVLKNSGGEIVDEISYGLDNFILNPAIDDVTRGHSISRSPNGFDSDNATDFIDLASPTPGS